MNHIEIKNKAKELRKEKMKDFWIGYLIVLAISFLVTFGIGMLFDENSTLYACFTLLASVFTSTLTVGLYAYILKMVRGESYTREDIFAFIPKAIPIFTISLLVGIFSLLWGLLLIIPGIIAAISYSMAYYLFVEDDNKLPMEYLAESKKMMKGYKMDYFLFMLSFIGWILLSFLTFGILLIWVIPYIAFSEAIYFDELKKITANKCE